MDEQALERARQRIAAGAGEGLAGPRLDAALERARAEIMRLAHVADELEESLPKQMETAMRDGIAREVVPVSRSLAEIRGSVNQALRRLERLEQELLAERNARIDDLGILVDLISSGWNGVDARLGSAGTGLETSPGGVRPRETRKRRSTYEVASTTAQTAAQPATVTSSGTSSTRSVSGSSPRPRRWSRSR